MAQAPGTVSKILWHFTGGPRWNTAENCQEGRPKPETEAYQALLSILRARELRLGEYRDVVKVRVKLRRGKKETGKTVKNAIREMRSSRVCCLSDIPIAHLSYQAKRYGKIAIGFHRDAVVRHGFNPVFYTLQNTDVIRSIRRGFRVLRNADTSSITSAASDIESKALGLECDEGHEVDAGMAWEIRDIELGARDIADAISSAQENLKKFLAFVKTFGPREFSTIYCEREWRSTEKFPFSENDLAMIVLPRKSGRGSYFHDFVNRQMRILKIPRSVPVVAWEDLIEH